MLRCGTACWLLYGRRICGCPCGCGALGGRICSGRVSMRAPRAPAHSSLTAADDAARGAGAGAGALVEAAAWLAARSCAAVPLQLLVALAPLAAGAALALDTLPEGTKWRICCAAACCAAPGASTPRSRAALGGELAEDAAGGVSAKTLAGSRELVALPRCGGGGAGGGMRSRRSPGLPLSCCTGLCPPRRDLGGGAGCARAARFVAAQCSAPPRNAYFLASAGCGAGHSAAPPPLLTVELAQAELCRTDGAALQSRSYDVKHASSSLAWQCQSSPRHRVAKPASAS
jgi:hypothetical protein